MKFIYTSVFTPIFIITACSSVGRPIGTAPPGEIQDSFGGDSNSIERGERNPARSCFVSSRGERLDEFYGNRRLDYPTIPSSVSYRKWEGENFDEAIRNWHFNHQASKEENARFYKYIYIPLSLLEDPNSANAARIGLFKALNSTAFYGDDIYVGEEASEDYGALYAIDTRLLWGHARADDGPAMWNCITNPLSDNGNQTLSEGVISVGPMAVRNLPDNEPVHAAQLVYNLLHPNVYNETIDTPGSQSGLLRMLGVERVSYDNVLAWTAQKDAIVNGPRVSKMIRTADGRNYWATQDYFANVEGRDIPYAVGDPIPKIGSGDGWIDLPSLGDQGFSFDGSATRASEAWVEMRNGLISYYIWGNAHQERGRAEQSFVTDPQNNRNGYLVTGRSCITCHVGGVQRAPSEMNRLIRDGAIGSQYIEEARDFWTPDETIEKYYDETAVRFQAAMRKIVLAVSDASESVNRDFIESIGGEPVKYLIDYVEEGFIDED